MTFNYVHVNECDHFSFYRIPKVFFTDDRFKAMPTEAKVLFGLMLDRVSLSKKNHWADENGHVYIIYTLEQVQKDLNVCNGKACKLMKVLESYGLITRIRRGLTKPDLIFPKNIFSTNYTSCDCNNSFHEVDDSNFSEFTSGISECDTFEVHEDVYLNSINPDLNESDFAKKTEFTYSDSINQINQSDVDAMNREIEEMEVYFKEKWGYISLIDTYSEEEVSGLITLAAEVVCSNVQTCRIGRQNISSSRVAQRFKELDMTHIDYVLESVHKTKTKIQNPRNYLLAALYNAPTTIGTYIENLYARNESL